MEPGPRPESIARSVAADLAAAVLLAGLVVMIYLLGAPYAPIREPAWSISLIFAAVTLAVALGVSRLRRQRHEEFLTQQLAAERERTALAERVAHLMRSANDVILLTDENFRIVEANDRALETYGYTLAELQEKKMVELRAPEHRTTFPQVAERLAAERRAFLETVHQRKDGMTFPVEVSIRLVEIGGVPYTLGIIRDITERREAEGRQRLALDALELLNRAGNVSSLSSKLLRLIKNSTGFDAVGLRLREGDDFPYYEQSGFSDAFVRAENSLCAKGADGCITRDPTGRAVLECTCGVVLSGRADASMACFTKGGSFWTNASSELPALAPEDDRRVNPRNRCINAGYESVALIPLRSGDETIGLLQLNDRRRGRLSPDLVQFFEGLGASIGIALKRKQAEEAAAESERRYRQTVEASPDAIGLHSEGKILFVNPAAVRLAGAKNADELVGRPMLEVVHPDDRDKASQRVRFTLETGMPAPTTEQKFVRLDGSVVDAEIISYPVLYLGKQVIQVLLRDITERKRAEEALRESEERFRCFSDAAFEGIVIHERGKILAVNSTFAAMFGYEPAELIGMSVLDVAAPEARDLVQENIFSEYEQPYEGIGLRKDGSTFVNELRGKAIRYQGRSVRITALRDITERKRAEQALRTAAQEWQTTFDSLNDAVWLLDKEQRVVRGNEATRRILQRAPSELIGRHCWEVVHGTSEPIAGCPFVRMRKSLRRETMELQRDGQWFEVAVDPIVDEAGQLTGAVHLVSDITERKRAEAEQAALFEIAKDIAGVVDLNEILKRLQQRVATLLPCDRITTYYWDAARSTYRALAWHGVPSPLEPDTVALEFHSGQPVAERLLAGQTVLINDIANQSLVPLEILTHFGLTAALVVPVVVRGRMRGALAALNAESGRRFDPRQVRLFEGIAQHVGVAVEAADLYRAQEEEAAIAGAFGRVGQEIISSLSSPALLDRLCQLTTEVLGCDRSHTWLWQASDEAFVPVAGYGDSPEQWENMRLVKFGRSEPATELDDMERNGVFNIKIADLPDSEARAWACAFGVTAVLMVPLRRGGELVGFHTADYCGREEVFGERHKRIARGIGQLASLALENVRLIDELEQANRLKSDFVATMSHELRTPLNIIMGYNDLLLDGGFGPLTEEQLDTLQRIEKSAEELLELITATLDLSRLDTGQVQLDVQAIALADLVSELDAEISGLRQNPNVDFTWDVAPELPELCSDPAKLKVVLKNLIGNAIKFTHAGSVVVRLRARDGGVEITVADTGIGIAREMLPVIFEPFRQGEPVMTRQHGGVGLGLYIVRRVLDMLGGTIDAESTLGQGSTFRVWVPSRLAV
jgi:PAS domain S-box-containing protein